MEPKKYKYNAGRMFIDVLLLLVITGGLYINLMNNNPDHKPWLVFGIALLIPLARFIYLLVMYIMPCLKGKTALELDIDKLQLHIKGKLLLQIPRDVAYWKDIKEVNYTAPLKGSAIISFKMNDGSAFGFRTAYIAGDSSDIYDTIMAYFNNR